MTDEDALYHAESLSDLQCAVILLCQPKQSWGYNKLAELTGSTYAAVKSAGAHLQGANLASVSYVRQGGEFAGSAIFLNARGEQVRQMVERIASETK